MSMLIQQVKVFLVDLPSGGVAISSKKETLLKVFISDWIKEEEIPYFAIPSEFLPEMIYYIAPEQLLGP